jgi:hypothetical protein
MFLGQNTSLYMTKDIRDATLHKSVSAFFIAQHEMFPVLHETPHDTPGDLLSSALDLFIIWDCFLFASLYLIFYRATTIISLNVKLDPTT